jgi:hypothetical protein
VGFDEINNPAHWRFSARRGHRGVLCDLELAGGAIREL